MSNILYTNSAGRGFGGTKVDPNFLATASQGELVDIIRNHLEYYEFCYCNHRLDKISIDLAPYIEKITDESVRIDFLGRYFKIAPPVITKKIDENVDNELANKIWDASHDISRLPLRYRTFDRIKEAVGSAYYNMKYVFGKRGLLEGISLKEAQQREICEFAHSKSAVALIYTPVEYSSKEKWQQLISSDYNFLLYCPPEFATKENWIMAIEANPLFLTEVPLEYIELEKDFLRYYDDMFNALINGRNFRHLDEETGEFVESNRPPYVYHLFNGLFRKSELSKYLCTDDMLYDLFINFPNVLSVHFSKIDAVTQNVCDRLYRSWIALIPDESAIQNLFKLLGVMEKIRKKDFFEKSTFSSLESLKANFSAEEKARFEGIDWGKLTRKNEWGYDETCFDITPVALRTYEGYRKKRRTNIPISGFDSFVQKGGYYAEIYYSNRLEQILKIPEDLRDQTMCEMAYIKYGVSALESFIPVIHRTKDMWIMLLNGNIDSFKKYLRELFPEAIDSDILSIIIDKMQSMIIEQKGTVVVPNSVAPIILNVAPTLLKVFASKDVDDENSAIKGSDDAKWDKMFEIAIGASQSDDSQSDDSESGDSESSEDDKVEEINEVTFDFADPDDIIWNDLVAIATDGSGSLEEIAEKYDVGVVRVATVLKFHIDTDLETCKKIDAVLDSNRNKMMSDVGELGSIINFLGVDLDGDITSLTTDEKVKLSYLSSRLLEHSLTDIYIFNSKLGDKKSSYDVKSGYNKELDYFFRTFLKFNIVCGHEFCDSVGAADLANLFEAYSDNNANAQGASEVFYNVPMEVYDSTAPSERRSFISRFFGKKRISYARNLTPEDTGLVIKLLNDSGIPLNNIIVKEAFRAYANNNLDDYIGRVKGYDEEYKNFMSSSTMAK